MDIVSTIGSALGLGFLSGIRLYATVLALGLAIRFHAIDLSQQMSALQVLADTRVLIAAGAICAVEFLADKVAWIDSIWDSIHTFIRPIAAVALTGTALGDMDPVFKTILALVAGGVALTAHSTKAATRLAVNHSPEPFSNVALSVVEDIAAPVGLWFIWQYPAVFLGLLAVFLTLFAIFAPRIWRAFRFEFAALGGLISNWFGDARERQPAMPAGVSKWEAGRAVWSRLRGSMGEIPEGLAREAGASEGVRCAATKSIRGLQRSVGYLCFAGEDLVFVTRRGFRVRSHRIPLSSIRDSRWKSGFFIDDLTVSGTNGDFRFDVFKTAAADAPAAELAASGATR